mgnify:CR=1 FL=1
MVCLSSTVSAFCITVMTVMTSDFEGFPSHMFVYLFNSWERVSSSLLSLSGKKGNYWVHVYIAYGMTQNLTSDLLPSNPALYH